MTLADVVNAVVSREQKKTLAALHEITDMKEWFVRKGVADARRPTGREACSIQGRAEHS